MVEKTGLTESLKVEWMVEMMGDSKALKRAALMDELMVELMDALRAEKMVEWMAETTVLRGLKRVASMANW